MRSLWIPCLVLCLTLGVLLSGCINDAAPGPDSSGITGSWRIWHTEDGREGGPDYVRMDRSGNQITMTYFCSPDIPSMAGVIDGTEIVLVMISSQDTTTAVGTISGNTIAGTWTSTSGVSGTWRGEKMEGTADQRDCVTGSLSVFCVRFLNDQYWVEGVIDDPDKIIRSATLSGSRVTRPIPFTYNLYPDRPGEWWTDPNVFISEGAAPSFPLSYVVQISFQDGSTRTVSRTVLDWEWASGGDEDPPPGAQVAHLISGSSFDFSTGAVDPSGLSGDFQYVNFDMIGLSAPSGVSWWTGEGLQDFIDWISTPSYLPPAEAYIHDSSASGSGGRYTRWLKTGEGRYAMVYSVAASEGRLDFFYVYPYGDFAWSDTEAPEPGVLTSVRSTATSGELLVEWGHSPSPDAAGYVVSYGTDPGSKTGRHAGYATAHILSGLESGRSYYVWILAYDREGNQSEWSAPMTGTPR